MTQSCEDKTVRFSKKASNTATLPVSAPEPNYNYRITVPDDWFTLDTAIEGLSVRYIKTHNAPTKESPMGNVVIAFMENRPLDEFTTRNIHYLRSNMSGITLLGQGDFTANEIRAKWFTYTKDQNGIKRDMINYIIPLQGFAYMITCGANAGYMPKYRSTFDKIAASFRG